MTLQSSHRRAITLTFDLEDPAQDYTPQSRYSLMTDRLLELCDHYQRHATFFVVGKVASLNPLLIKKIAQRGHEIAYHSQAHVSLSDETRPAFTTAVREDKDRLEQLSGHALLGYRAPCFSLTPRTLWATDALKQLGLVYSSSVMPTRLSRFGYPGAPKTPFVWPSGLIEFPLPVSSCKHLPMPYLGGVYLYLTPSFLTRRLIRQAGADQALWTYAHPQDLDVDEAFHPLPDASWLTSLVLWYARGFAERSLKNILNNSDSAPCLGVLAESLIANQTALPLLPAE